MVLLLIAGIAYAKNYEVTKKAGEYTVVATIDKNPPAVGDNNISIDNQGCSRQSRYRRQGEGRIFYASDARHARDEL